MIRFVLPLLRRGMGVPPDDEIVWEISRYGELRRGVCSIRIYPPQDLNLVSQASAYIGCELVDQAFGAGTKESVPVVVTEVPVAVGQGEMDGDLASLSLKRDRRQHGADPRQWKWIPSSKKAPS